MFLFFLGGSLYNVSGVKAGRFINSMWAAGCLGLVRHIGPQRISTPKAREVITKASQSYVRSSNRNILSRSQKKIDSFTSVF